MQAVKCALQSATGSVWLARVDAGSLTCGAAVIPGGRRMRRSRPAGGLQGGQPPVAVRHHRKVSQGRAFALRLPVRPGRCGVLKVPRSQPAIADPTHHVYCKRCTVGAAYSKANGKRCVSPSLMLCLQQKWMATDA